jgi:hypothetical protein
MGGIKGVSLWYACFKRCAHVLLQIFGSPIQTLSANKRKNIVPF